jgi:hypothetical protein
MSVVRLALLASITFAGAAAPAHANILIRVDQSTQRMSVDVDGQHRYDWRVSTGRPGYDTPSGDFRPNRMDANHFSKEYDNAPMPHAIFFDLHGHAIHGSYDPVGHPAASHGCVRLDPANAATLFGLVKEEGMAKTQVDISGDVTIALRNARPMRARVAVVRTPRIKGNRYGLGEVYGQTASYGSQPDQSSRYDDQPGAYQYGGQPSYGYPVYNQPNYDRSTWGW